MSSEPITSKPRHDEDLTGRSRLTVNVLVSWLSYFVIIITGFILPRMIDNNMGQASLGIWDFAWSLVNTLTFMGLGVGSSINRYVALHRSKHDEQALRQAISTVSCIQVIIGFMTFLATLALFYLLPILYSDTLGEHIEELRWVIFLLGIGLAIQMTVDVFRGILTGCHRFDIHNWINAAFRLLTAVFMIISLIIGGTLFELSLIYLIGVIISELIRAKMAYKVCPEIHFAIQYIKWETAKEMLTFGGKSFIFPMPQLIIQYAVNILMLGALGPAALAIFARPFSLVQHIKTFLVKYQNILTPTAAVLYANNDGAELKNYFLDNTRYGAALVIPLLLFLAILGDFLIHIWMGPHYVYTQLIIVLALGRLLPIVQGSAGRILVGLNLHGRIAFYNIFTSLFIFSVGFAIVEQSGWSLEKAAWLYVVPIFFTMGFLTPAYACHHIKITFVHYIRNTFLVPLSCSTVYGVFLYIIRTSLHDSIILALLIGLAGGLIIMPLLYWNFLLTEQEKETIMTKIRKVRSRSS